MMIADQHPRLVLLLLALVAIDPTEAVAGTLYRCDDGRGASIYQTLPCAADQRTVERREYEDPATAGAAVAKMPEAGRDSRQRVSTPRPPRVRASADGRAAPEVVAHECRLGSERWVQAGPCVPVRAAARRGENSTRSTRTPGQRALDREEACRRVREARHERAPGERSADSVYRRNLLRERGGC
jgi:hypothetical protein